MLQWKFLTLLLVMVVTSGLAADAPWGVWADKEQKHTYAFLKNNEFRFWGEKVSTDGVWQSGSRHLLVGGQQATDRQSDDLRGHCSMLNAGRAFRKQVCSKRDMEEGIRREPNGDMC